MSVHVWGCISHKGDEIIHRIEGQLDGLQYQHILQKVMVPSVPMFYPDGTIHLQQDHSSIHDSRVVQEWLSWHADVELLDLPPRASAMNIENMWSEVKRTMQETWPVLPHRNSDKLWDFVSDTSGMKLLRLRVTFDHWLSPWHDEWNQWSKQTGSRLLIKEVNFWQKPF